MYKVLVLISGAGSILKSLIEAAAVPGFPAIIVAVGADRDAEGLAHADAAGIPSFVTRFHDYPSREAWGQALLEQIDKYQPDLVVSAGLMRILPRNVVSALSPQLINTHPAYLPAFPGAHAVRDALAAGVSETGLSVFVIDEGVDTGRIIDQRKIAVLPGDTEAELHERIKAQERVLLPDLVAKIAAGEIQLEGEK